MPAIRICLSCGQKGHLRSTSRLCLNNTRSNSSTCASCGGIGHRRSSHRDCANNIANRPQPETMEVDQQAETISANDATTSSPVCSSCGQEGHLRPNKEVHPLSPSAMILVEGTASVAIVKHECGH
ncbi:hypothetical protein BD408DRAFT_438874 [Parasitella parasitica]|nr:hypothetical protein BD408DRAFT_447516 [Parasitella parasitica]KAI8647840.1 hypothetical protein BD408DRAFT_438874 [Parasitella parasitica]